MVWRVTRTNEKKNETIEAPTDYGTGELAFRAAMDNVVKFITDHWDSAVGPGEDGPANDNKFKVLIDRRITGARVTLRYDWHNGVDYETNDIYWTIAEV